RTTGSDRSSPCGNTALRRRIGPGQTCGREPTTVAAPRYHPIVIWGPFVLALVLGLIVSAGLYYAYLWPQVDPDDPADPVEPETPRAKPSEATPETTKADPEPPETPAEGSA